MESPAFPIPAGLVAQLRAARHVAVLTGAGISAESGIPTFRDAQSGLWAQYRPQDLATPQAFQRNPKLVWEWYAERRQQVLHVQPNPGHLALVELERRVPQYTLITQNIDGLHARAGSQRVIELHGNVSRVKCSREGRVVAEWPPTDEVPPRCPHCGGLLRPDVVWFGEMLPEQAIEDAWAATRACDLFLSIGTSATVEPAASLPVLASSHGATVAVINPEVNSVEERDYYALRGPAGTVLPALLRAVGW